MKNTLFVWCLCLIAGTLGAQNVTYSFSETYPVQESAELIVRNGDGDIHVLAHDATEIKVHYRVLQNDKDLKLSREEFETLTDTYMSLTTTHSNNQLDIQIKKNWRNNFARNKNDIVVDLIIYVPSKTKSELASSDGDISLVGLNNDQKMVTSDGDIEVKDLSGNLFAKSSDGDLELEQINGNIELRTSDGDIKVKYFTGSLDAKTSDGDIELEHSKGEISVKTSDGDIVMRDVQGELKSKTGDGDLIQKQ